MKSVHRDEPATIDKREKYCAERKLMGVGNEGRNRRSWRHINAFTKHTMCSKRKTWSNSPMLLFLILGTNACVSMQLLFFSKEKKKWSEEKPWRADIAWDTPADGVYWNVKMVSNFLSTIARARCTGCFESLNRFWRMGKSKTAWHEKYNAICRCFRVSSNS